MPGLEGTTLGHHYLKRLLGRGGMAEVYLARDTHLGRQVALKVVHAHHLDHLARFRREAEIIGPLTHDHILTVFEYGAQGDWHYLVLPYAASGSLDDLLQQKGTLSAEEAGVLLEQVAHALQFAHDRGILHRDIKPSNILLRDPSYAYLADFGIAKSKDEHVGLTQVGTIVGTPQYMAPELLEEPASPSSDLYALGIVLYQMLTGRVPFEGKTTLSVLHKHAQDPPLRPSVINPAIPPAIEQVILCAIEKDPKRRFPTPEAMVQAYKQALHAATGHLGTVPVPPLILRSPTRSGTPSASQATERTALPAGPAYRPRPKRLWLPLGLLAGIAAVALLLVLVPLLPNLLNTAVTNQAATPTVTLVPSPTSTSAANACGNQGQVTIQDTAEVLDRTQICDATMTWPYLLTILTTNTSSNLTDTANALRTSDRMVVMAIGIDTSHNRQEAHIIIIGGSSVPISDQQYHNAMEAFTHQAKPGAYTQATLAAIAVLQTAQQQEEGAQ